MKQYIRDYGKFFESEETDNAISNSSIHDDIENNRIEDLDERIKEYNSKKTSLYNIYMQYTDKESLKSSLVSSGYAEKDGDTVKFKNPLLRSYGRIADTYRKIRDTEDYIKMQKEEIQIKKKAISDNPNLEEGLKSQIDNIEERIDNSEDKIRDYKDTANELTKVLDDRVKEMKKDLEELKRNSN